jgi:putative transcriptional regulator
MLRNSVEAYRRGRGVSKSHLARQINVCPSYITRLINGEIQPSGDVMFRLAGYFKCPVEELFQQVVDEDKSQSLRVKLPLRQYKALAFVDGRTDVNSMAACPERPAGQSKERTNHR